jgi:deoxyribodipyrimidine photo-lyase
VLWFRRDLRLADHPALVAAADSDRVVPLFVVDPIFAARAGRPRLAFLAASLAALAKATDGALVVRRGDPTRVVPGLAKEAGATTVVVSEDFGPYGRRRDEDVGAALADAGGRLQSIGSPYAVEPGRVTKRDGSPYSVFTPFARAWVNVGWDEPVGEPKVRWTSVKTDALPDWSAGGVALPSAGERAAHERLDRFLAGPIRRYDEDRDRPDLDGTSHLSVDLRWGALHPRQVLDRLGAGRAAERFRTEVAWREFYADVLFHHPESSWQDLDRRMEALPVDTDRAATKRLARWAEGTTGFPIVDAGQRQLLATGWMPNRVRMLTASFLVKDLHVPWQWGARHFLRHLVDGDLASNNHNWQWVAGTGTDAAPYFRIFNPVTQAKRFDPDGAYVRRWLPQLEGVADGHVHQPWASPKGLPLGYPPPMVDHAVEREEALRRHGLVTRGNRS